MCTTTSIAFNLACMLWRSDQLVVIRPGRKACPSGGSLHSSYARGQARITDLWTWSPGVDLRERLRTAVYSWCPNLLQLCVPRPYTRVLSMLLVKHSLVKVGEFILLQLYFSRHYQISRLRSKSETTVSDAQHSLLSFSIWLLTRPGSCNRSKFLYWLVQNIFTLKNWYNCRYVLLNMGVTIQNLYYGEFLNLYGGGQANSILTTGISLPHRH
jgi:hypothetical protein